MHPGKKRAQQHGFTLLAVLAAMFLLGLATQGVMTWVSHEVRREREARLLEVGQSYVQAIGSYYEASPGVVKQWPMSLDDLTDDKRFVGIRRHLRKLYPDPIRRSREWGLVTVGDGGGIAGVYSRSEEQPLRSVALDLGGLVLDPAQRYSDWKFVYRPPAAVTGRDQ
jgi:type II secretory pathway pseudopilin PulG